MSILTSRGFYKPQEGWVGDVIPFAHEGRAWLYYLHEHRGDPKPGTPWSLVSTQDFVTFEEHGVAIESGGRDADDFNAYTGSVIEHEGVFYLFYTGHNPDRLGADGVPLQLVKVALSHDGMKTWEKQPELTFGAPEGYEDGDWRDPFVYRVEGESQWRMLMTARRKEGPDRRRGVIAQLRSSDLRHWEIAEPLYAPNRYVAHECPEVFKWGEWWYLVYSEFTDSFVTRYRMSRSPDGPWIKPERDSIDGRAFYASKSLELGNRRFFIGWIASKEGERDSGPYQWAGTMSTLEATQNPDGTLAFSTPQEIRDTYGELKPLELDGSASDGSLILDAQGGHRVAMTDSSYPGTMRFSCEIEWDGTLEAAGVMLRGSPDGDQHYAIRLEPERNRVVLDSWPRKKLGDMQWQVSGDVPYAVELERPCTLDVGTHKIDVITEGSSLVVTVNDQVAMSARLYDHPAGHIGVFATEGVAKFRNVAIATVNEQGTDATLNPEEK